MSIYVLVILCAYMSLALIGLNQSYNDKDAKYFSYNLIAFILTILAIIFQSINL